MKKTSALFLFLFLNAVTIPAESEDRPLAFIINADKTTYEEGETIQIQNRIQNIGNDPIKIFDPTVTPYPSGYIAEGIGIRFVIRDPNNKTYEIYLFDQYQAMYRWQPKNIRQLKPNETLEVESLTLSCEVQDIAKTMQIAWGRKDPTTPGSYTGPDCNTFQRIFSLPGEYRITGFYGSSGETSYDPNTKTKNSFEAWKGTVPSNTVVIEIKPKIEKIIN